MSQMAPFNWLFLFIMFTVIFLLFNVMNYYSIFPTSLKSEKNEFKMNSFN